MTFAKFVKKTIDDRHLSARRVAKAAGLDPSFFSQILSGKRSPPSDERILKKLARALGADPVFLMFLSGRIPEDLREIFLNEKFIASLRRSPSSSSAPPAGFEDTVKIQSPPSVSADLPDIGTNRTSAGEDISEDLL